MYNVNVPPFQAILATSVTPIHIHNMYCSLGLILLILRQFECINEGPTVKTQFGDVNGMKETVDGTLNANVFLGIPYAEPPTGNLRFKKPVTPASWNGTLNGTRFSSDCMQSGNVRQSEDCLYLNIYVPGSVITAGRHQAVMIWIHGGGFLVGAGRYNDGSKMAARHGVIVVTLNYRLGVLGFLSTGDAAAPGNLGLWDQHTAIKWVHDNIDAFGGDNTKITLFGLSAGGVSVTLQALSLQNRGLFQRVISESGSTLSKRMLNKNTSSIAKDFASKFGCNVTESIEMVECLRKIRADLVQKEQDLYLFNSGPIFVYCFPPVADGDFIIESPFDLFKYNGTKENEITRMFAGYDYLAGFNDGEGTVVLYTLEIIARHFKEDISVGMSEPSLNYVLNVMAAEFYTDNPSTFVSLVKNRFFAHTSNITENARSFLDIYGFCVYSASTVQLLNGHLPSLGNGSRYLYYLSVNNPAMNNAESFPKWFNGSGHGSEAYYVFDEFKPSWNETTQQLMISRDVMAYWSNFAKTGDPNLPTGLNKTLKGWPPYKANTTQYIKFGQDSISLDNVNFWLKTLPNALKLTDTSNTARAESFFSATFVIIFVGANITY